MVIRSRSSLLSAAFVLLTLPLTFVHADRNMAFVRGMKTQRFQRNGSLAFQNEAVSTNVVERRDHQPPQTMPVPIGTVLNNQYELTSYIPVASTKCELYEAFRRGDTERTSPLIVKMSPRSDQIDLEYRNYRAVFDRLGQDKQHLFVKIHDKIDPGTNEMAAIVMERGEDNLRFDIGRKGALRGDKLRHAMEAVLSSVEALHDIGMVWTEIKAENFVIQANGAIKGIDLESVVPQNEYMRMYTAEACPPEFPVQEMYKCLPRIRMEYSFDVWGVGMTLFELATGQPFYSKGLTNLEYIKGMLSNPQALIAHRDAMLLSVDPEAREIIKRCLEIDPNSRSSCRELLQAPYFVGQKGEHSSSIGEKQQGGRALSSFFGAPEPTEQSKTPVGKNQVHSIPSALEHLRLPLNAGGLLESALNLCEQHNPLVVNYFWYSVLKESASSSLFNDQIPTAALNSLLDVILVCDTRDQGTADKLLSILEEKYIIDTSPEGCHRERSAEMAVCV